MVAAQSCELLTLDAQSPTLRSVLTFVPSDHRLVISRDPHLYPTFDCSRFASFLSACWPYCFWRETVFADVRIRLRSVLSRNHATIRPQTIPSSSLPLGQQHRIPQQSFLSDIDQQRLGILEQHVTELHSRMNALDDVLSNLQHILEQPRSPPPSSLLSEYSFTTNNTWSSPSPSVVAGQRSSLYPKRSLGSPTSPSFDRLDKQNTGSSHAPFKGQGSAWKRDTSFHEESDSDSDSASDTTVSSIGSMGRHYEMVR